MRRILQILAGLLVALASVTVISTVFNLSTEADRSDDANQRKIENYKKEWQELCAEKDCDQFPVDYATYAFGPDVYYLPLFQTMTEKPPNVFTGGVKLGRYVDLDEDNQARRSYSDGGGLIIAECCHHLLSFYGLTDDLPVFRENKSGNRMPSAWTTISSYDRPDRYNRLDRLLDLELDETPSIHEIIDDEQPSFNDDFWLLFSGAPDAKGARELKLLSKRSLLNGRHVMALCYSLCTFGTVSLAEDADDKRPHVALRWMRLRGEQPCVPAGSELGCPPAADALDKVAQLLSVLDEMFVMAQSRPSAGN